MYVLRCGGYHGKQGVGKKQQDQPFYCCIVDPTLIPSSRSVPINVGAILVRKGGTVIHSNNGQNKDAPKTMYPRYILTQLSCFRLRWDCCLIYSPRRRLGELDDDRSPTTLQVS